MSYNNFSELKSLTRLSNMEIANLCGCSKRDVKGWIKENNAPKVVVELLNWYYNGVPQVKTWENWKLRNGSLVSPIGMEFDSEDLELMPVLYLWKEEEKRKFELSL